jgi:uncharacterized protein (DUF885 family)
MPLSSLLSQYFHETLEMSPSFSVFLRYRVDDTVFENSYSKEYQKKIDAIVDKYRGHLDNIPLPKRSMDDKVLEWICERHREVNRYNFHLMPISSFENIIIDFTFYNKTMYETKDDKDVMKLIARHRDMLGVMDSIKEHMKRGVKLNYTISKRICRKVIENIALHIKRKSYLITLPSTLQGQDAGKEFTTFLEKTYRPALEGFLRFCKDEYLPHCTDTDGLCHLKNGRAMYKALIRQETTLDIQAASIHEIGLQEVARIEKEMHRVKQQLGYPNRMQLKQFYNMIMKDPNQYFKTPEEVIKHYKNLKKTVRKNILKKHFDQLVSDYDVIAVPKSMEASSAGAFFYPGSYDQKRRGAFYVNLRDVKENQKYSMYSLSLHEAEPGHHYQFQYMIDNKLPIHKIFSINGNAYVEGWALYAESLGDYQGSDINTLYNYFGRLTYEMFRAVRLVVDTGLHHYGWSFQKAVGYMSKYLAMKKSEIVTEVERYICIPGQALSYKMGELTLQKLQAKYVAKFGSDLKPFHKLVLENGILPLKILEEKIENYIDGKR